MSTGNISKAEKAARAKGEKALKLSRDELKAPDWLPDKAALEFERVCKDAEKLDMLDNLDLAVLAVYADNYNRYVEASTQLSLHGHVITTDKGYAMPSPWISILNQTAKNIFSCSAKLGLAVTDRLKLIVPVKEEKTVNKFTKFLSDGSNG